MEALSNGFAVDGMLGMVVAASLFCSVSSKRFNICKAESLCGFSFSTAVLFRCALTHICRVVTDDYNEQSSPSK